MKVTSWNLLHGEVIPPDPSQDNPRTRLSAAIRKIAAESDSDFFAFQEVDLQQKRSDSLDQIKLIAAEISAPYWAFAPALIGTPGEEWRGIDGKQKLIFTNHSPVHDSQPYYGIGIVSKIPIKKWHHLHLGRSLIGAPLLVPAENSKKKSVRVLYIKDEPRIALAAELENGFTIATTHLSFVPFMNLAQLRKVTKWLGSLPGKPILTGDLNLPWNLGEKISGWQSLNKIATYPSWKPSIQFDYILSQKKVNALPISHRHYGLSDHIPISVEIRSN